MQSKYLQMLLLWLATILLVGCYRLPPELRGDYEVPTSGQGGGQDAVTIDLPFADGYRTLCTQCAGGEYSHSFQSTYYDVDLDTPNDQDDLVYAPVGGVAHVHDDDPDSGFGIHVNIDLDDGTYIVIGHLSDTLVEDEEEVVAGSMIGFEGSTGNSSGDHVHMGRHQGSASEDAGLGASVEGLFLRASSVTTGETDTFQTTEMTCSLSDGHTYESLLKTSLWHPNGSLVKTPEESIVYLLDEGAARPIATEAVFWDMNYDFADLALISDAELDCYADGSELSNSFSIRAVYDGVKVWLLVNENGVETRREVPLGHWQAVLKSWGIQASTYDDLLTEEQIGVSLETVQFNEEPAAFRDGALVRENTDSTVYVISDGIAMPVENWDVFVLMDFATREILWVDDGAVNAVQGRVGNCSVDTYCISYDDVTTCGGPSGEEGVLPDSDEDSATTPEDTGTNVSGTDTGVPAISGPLSLTWSRNGEQFDRIELSGEFVHADGVSEGWQVLATEYGATDLVYERADVEPGDSLRFSVEFEANGVTSWSCLAPFPPGTVQGVANTAFNGVSFPAYPVGDPASAGCGLLATVP